MSALTTIFPRLEGIPRVPIADGPTPVEPLRRSSEVLDAELWCKRDDLTAAGYGGNKVRKLEYLLGDAQRRGCDALVTTGALGSHHVLATAIHGGREGFGVHAVLVPQPLTSHVQENLRLGLAHGAVLHPSRNPLTAMGQMARLAAKLGVSGRRPYLIGPGGSSPTGCLGYVAAGVELGMQLDARELPAPDAIYVAIGSGATAVGLSLGLCAAGHSIPVCAVRCTDSALVSRAALLALSHATEHRLRRVDPGFPRVAGHAMRQITVVHHQFGRGYGHGTAASAEAMALADEDGLGLDETYTAKAFGGLVRDARGPLAGKRLLFMQTLSSAELPSLDGAPPPPPWATRHAARGR